MQQMNTDKKPVSLLTAGAATLALALGAGTVAAGSDAWQGEMNDAWLDGKVETSFTLNRYLNPFAIDTEVKNGVVMLSGTVESEVDKELAGEIALGVDGVKKVENRLQVKPGTRDAGDMPGASGRPRDNEGRDFAARFDDATTTARVKYALLTHDGTNALDIDVDTINGVVVLSGSVASGEERDLAGQVAANTDGVAEVENELGVKRGGS